MPTSRHPRSSRTPAARALTRAQYARTNADMLTGGSYTDNAYSWSTGPGIDPSGQPPIWWVGLDTSGGSHPIGPNGPWTNQGQGLPVVTRAVSLICGPLSAAPFKVAELGFGGQPLPRPRWVTDPCLLRPDSRYVDDVFAAVAKQPRGGFFFTWIRDACLFGTGAFLCQEDAFGQPLAGTMRNVNPFLLSTERSPDDGSLRWVLGADGAASADRAVFGRDGYLTLGSVRYRLVALRNPHGMTDVDGHTPGVFEQHPGAFKLGAQVATYASGTFRSGIPAGYLKVDSVMDSMTQEQADDLKAKWMNAHGGDRRSIAVLNSFTSFVPVNLSPVDAALGEVTRLNIGEIGYSFGLDPEVLGVTMSNSGTYKNAQEFWQRHKDFGLAPWIAAVEDTLTALLPASQGIRVDLDRFANPTPKERFDAYAVAIACGVLTTDECRELEGLPPLPAPVPAADPTPLPVPDPSPVAEPTPIASRQRPAALR